MADKKKKKASKKRGDIRIREEDLKKDFNFKEALKKIVKAGKPEKE